MPPAKKARLEQIQRYLLKFGAFPSDWPSAGLTSVVHALDEQMLSEFAKAEEAINAATWSKPLEREQLKKALEAAWAKVVADHLPLAGREAS